MNRTILKLFTQACYHSEYDPENVPNDVVEKFAELIVAHATECVRDVLRDEKSDLSYAAASQVQDRIKQYFGVSE